mmetsp:Transcript_4721/g.10394  ORF Transcript_4721/g.10394 Transcript_4721/m.10394 type:complete len:770 (+) Transcript_4721:281-2590(+)
MPRLPGACSPSCRHPSSYWRCLRLSSDHGPYLSRRYDVINNSLFLTTPFGRHHQSISKYFHGYLQSPAKKTRIIPLHTRRHNNIVPPFVSVFLSNSKRSSQVSKFPTYCTNINTDTISSNILCVDLPASNCIESGSISKIIESIGAWLYVKNFPGIKQSTFLGLTNQNRNPCTAILRKLQIRQIHKSSSLYNRKSVLLAPTKFIDLSTRDYSVKSGIHLTHVKGSKHPKNLSNFETTLKTLRDLHHYVKHNLSLDIWTFSLILVAFIVGPSIWTAIKESPRSDDYYMTGIPVDDPVEHSVRILTESTGDGKSYDENSQQERQKSSPGNKIMTPEEDAKRILNDLLASESLRTTASRIASGVIQSPPFQNACKVLVKNIWDDLVSDEETTAQLVSLVHAVLQNDRIYFAVKDLLLQLLNDEQVYNELTKLVVQLGEEREVVQATQKLLTESAHRTLNDPEVLDHSMEFATEVVGDDVVQRSGGEALRNTVGYAVQPSGEAVLAGLGTMIVAGVLHFYLMRGHGGSPGAAASAPRRDSSFDGGGPPLPSSVVGIDVVPPSTSQSTLPFISFGLINGNLSLAVKSAIDSTSMMARAPLRVLVSMKFTFTRIVVDPINEQFTRCSLGFELGCKRIGSSVQSAMECGMSMFCLPHAIWSTLSPLPTRLVSSTTSFFLSGFDQVAKKLLMLSGSFRTFVAATFQSWLVGVQVLKDNTSLIVANGLAQLIVGLLECEVRFRSVFNKCFQAGVDCWNYLGLILSNFFRQFSNTASVW